MAKRPYIVLGLILAAALSAHAQNLDRPIVVNIPDADGSMPAQAAPTDDDQIVVNLPPDEPTAPDTESTSEEISPLDAPRFEGDVQVDFPGDSDEREQIVITLPPAAPTVRELNAQADADERAEAAARAEVERLKEQYERSQQDLEQSRSSFEEINYGTRVRLGEAEQVDQNRQEMQNAEQEAERLRQDLIAARQRWWAAREKSARSHEELEKAAERELDRTLTDMRGDSGGDASKAKEATGLAEEPEMPGVGDFVDWDAALGADFDEQHEASQARKANAAGALSAGQKRLDDASNAGAEAVRAAGAAVSSAGADSSRIQRDAAREALRQEREQSWGKAMGDAAQGVVTEAGQAAASSLSQAGSESVASEIFGADEEPPATPAEAGGAPSSGAGAVPERPRKSRSSSSGNCPLSGGPK